MTRKQKIFGIISIVVIVLAVIIGHFLAQKPKVAVKPTEPVKTPVSVIAVNAGKYAPDIKVMGQVEAASKINLTAEVTGNIVKINKNFVPGGFIKKGDVILQIDQRDLKNALDQAKAAYLVSKAAYEQALGKADQAKVELQIYERNTGKKVKNSYLALRQPDLETARATLEKDKSALDQAQLNFDKTIIRAPFDAIVYTRDVGLNGYATPGTALATLVDTDVYWVNVSMPIQDLAEVDFTNQKNAITITLSNNRGTRKASFFKLLNYLDTGTRFVGALLVVSDPLLLKSKTVNKPVLLLDDYVNVDITGKQFPNIYRIPINALKSNNVVWLYDDGKLKLVNVTLVFQDDTYAYVKGLNDGDQVITSDLDIVSPGMLLTIDQ